MGSKIYGVLLPDYGDLDNVTGTAPGYRVYIVENDGGVGLQMIHANDDPSRTPGSAVFMNVNEAKEMLHHLKDAIDRAESKGGNHKDRAQPC